MATLSECVREAWRNGTENNEELATWPLDDIALDMIAYDDDVSNFVEGVDGQDADYDALQAKIVVILKEITGRET